MCRQDMTPVCAPSSKTALAGVCMPPPSECDSEGCCGAASGRTRRNCSMYDSMSCSAGVSHGGEARAGCELSDAPHVAAAVRAADCRRSRSLPTVRAQDPQRAASWPPRKACLPAQHRAGEASAAQPRSRRQARQRSVRMYLRQTLRTLVSVAVARQLRKALHAAAPALMVCALGCWPRAGSISGRAQP